MNTLQIAKGFSMPLKAQTETFAILAKREAGKTYTASVIAEEFAKADLRFVAIDPVGVWWGLRASADAKGPGLPVIVLGGEHGDLPLLPTAGEVVAETIVRSHGSFVLDLSLFRKGELVRFCVAFFEALYRLNREALHVFIDEADTVAPQKPYMGDAERLLGAVDDVVRRGRARGLGVTLITQRAAVLNKNVLSQCEVLVALRTIGKLDREAIAAWVDANGTPEQKAQLMESLPTLETGQAWFWSPSWLKTFEKVQIRLRETYDSGATPKAGEKRRTPGKLAAVDLAALEKTMAATVEEAKANDPKALRAEIARLKLELAKKETIAKTDKHERVKASAQVKLVTVTTVPVDVVGWIDDCLMKLQRAKEFCVKKMEDAKKKTDEVKATNGAESISQTHRRMFPEEYQVRRKAGVMDTKLPPPMPAPRVKPDALAPYSEGALSGAELRVLQALGWWNSFQDVKPERAAIAVIAGFSPTSGHYANILGSLRSKGLIVYEGNETMDRTSAGVEAGGAQTMEVTTEAVHAKVMSKLAAPEQKILQPLLDYYPASMSKDALAGKAGFSGSSGHFANLCGRLRTLGLIEYPQPGEARARDILFVNGQ